MKKAIGIPVFLGALCTVLSFPLVAKAEEGKAHVKSDHLLRLEEDLADDLEMRKAQDKAQGEAMQKGEWKGVSQKTLDDLRMVMKKFESERREHYKELKMNESPQKYKYMPDTYMGEYTDEQRFEMMLKRVEEISEQMKKSSTPNYCHKVTDSEESYMRCMEGPNVIANSTTAKKKAINSSNGTSSHEDSESDSSSAK